MWSLGDSEPVLVTAKDFDVAKAQAEQGWDINQKFLTNWQLALSGCIGSPLARRLSCDVHIPDLWREISSQSPCSCRGTPWQPLQL